MHVAVSIRSSVLWSVAEAVTNLTASLVTVLVVARAIGPEEFGIAAIAFFVTTIAETFVAVPFSEALIRLPSRDTVWVDTAFASMAALGVSMYVVLLGSAPFIAAFYRRPDLVGLISCQGLTCLALGFRGTVEAELAKDFRFRSLALRSILSKTSSTILAIVLAFRGAGAWSVVLGNVGFAFVSLLSVWFSLERRPRLRFNFSCSKRLLNFGAFSLADATLTVLTSKMFGLLIAHRYGSSAFGQTSAAFRINDSLVSLLATAATRVALPLFSRFQHDPARLVEMWAEGTRIAILFSAPAFIGLCFVSTDVIHLLLGPEWMKSSRVLVAVSIYSLFNFAAILVQPGLKAADRPATLVLVHAFSLFSLLILFFLLAPDGFDVAIFAYSSMGAVYWLTAIAVLGVVLGDRLWLRARLFAGVALSAGVMALTLYLSSFVTDTLTSPERLFVLVVVGIASYLAVLVLTERKMLIDLSRGFRRV